MFPLLDVFRNRKISTHQKWYRVEESPISGYQLGKLHIPRLTGCMVLALRRGDDITWAPENSLPVLDGDELYLSGTNAEMALFERAFGMSRVKAQTKQGGVRKIA